MRCSGMLVVALCVAFGTACYGLTAGQCDGGLVQCGDECVALAIDTTNCGACGSACAQGQVCVDGACAAGCPSDTVKCSQNDKPVCAHVATDDVNCGSCGNVCSSGKSCNAGKCTDGCLAGEMLCASDAGTVCIDPTSDNLNCGGCGQPCPIASKCAAGTCECVVGTSCGSYCSVLWDDHQNCGACFHACDADETCTSGSCTLVFVPHDVRAFVADDTDVYWATSYEIRRAPVTSPTSSTLVVQTEFTYALGIDAADVYWWGAQGTDTLNAISKTGTTGTVIGYPDEPFSLVGENGVVYGNTYDGIFGCPASGCIKAVSYITTDVAYAVRVKNGYLTYLDSSSVHHCLLPSCSNDFLAQTQQANNGVIGDLAIDDDTAYWTDRDFTSGMIESVSLSGGTPTTLASNLADPWFVQVDASNLYFVTSDGLFRMPKQGGAITQVAQVGSLFALVGNYIVMSIGDELVRLPK